MKKIFRAVAALAVVAFAGCTTDLENEVVAPGVGAGHTTVTVGIADTKVYFGDLEEDGTRKMKWHDGDKLGINGATSTAIERTEEKTSATFTFDEVLNYPYNALYPAPAYVDAQTIHLNSFQGRGLDGIQADVLPMAGYLAAEGETLIMHHLAGAVKYQISCGDKTTDMHSIRRLEVWGNNNEQMAGDFVIDYQNATLTAAGTNAESKVVVEIDKDQDESGIVTVYAVLPAIEYTKGITVRLIDKAGHYMDLASKAMTIEKGEIKAMPAVEFVPTGTIIDAEISIASAAEWNAFVKEYKTDKYEGVVVSVKFTQDIVFDDATNAEFQTIESSNGYFMGVLDGQNYSIKGLKTNKPIFNCISGSVLKNIVVDASCEWNYSDISLDANTWFGTLAVDIFSSTAENITFNGKSTYDAITANGLNLTVYTGNIFGRTNAQCIMKNCVNNGTLETLDTCNFGLKSDGTAPGGTVYSGGLVGYSRCPMENCTNNGAITSDWNANTKAIGGIVGRITGTGALVNCVNTGAITNNSRRKPAAPHNINDYNRNTYIGGIVGLPACDVTNCSNSGAVTANSNIKSIWIGGVVAYTNTDVGNFTNLSNSGAITSTDEVRYLAMGGVIGASKSKGIHSNLENTGEIAALKMENSSTVTMDVGGIIGQVSVDCTLDGTSAYNIVNKGNVRYEYNSTNDYNYLSVGGIVGTFKGKAIVKNVKNENPIQLLSNSGTNKNQTSYVGGIVGVIAGAGSTLENCINSNMVYTRERGNCYTDDTSAPLAAAQGYFGGGIIAFMMGDADNVSTITNCHNTCTLAHTANNSAGVVANRGYIGGVVAYAKYTNISDCSSTATMLGVNTSIRLGGIAAYLDNSHITGCSVTSPMLYSYNNTYIGGIASGVNAGSSIKNSTFNGTIAAEGAILTCKAVASFTKAGAVIENCGVAGSVLGTALTAENFAEHIVGDTNTTPTGCYLLTE